MYCNIPSNSDFGYGTGDFTWEIWANATSFTGNDYLIDHGSNGGTIAWQAPGVGDSLAGIRYYNTTLGTSGNLFMPGFGTSSAYVTNTWTHLVASRTSGTTSLYRNGIFITSGSDPHNYITQELNIGKYGGADSPNWNGKISNVKIYKGRGLSSVEVLQNFNALNGRFGL